MRKDEVVFQNQVLNVLDNREIINKKVRNTLVEECLNTYNYKLSCGTTVQEAEKGALEKLDGYIDIETKIKRDRILYFSLISITIMLFLSVLITIIGIINSDIKGIVEIINPLGLIIIIIEIIYLIISHKKRKLVDYIVIFILFVTSLSNNILGFKYLYTPRTGDYYSTLFYNFPGKFTVNTYSLISTEPLKYEITYSKEYFDFQLIVYIALFIILVIIFIVKRTKKEFTLM